MYLLFTSHIHILMSLFEIYIGMYVWLHTATIFLIIQLGGKLEDMYTSTWCHEVVEYSHFLPPLYLNIEFSQDSTKLSRGEKEQRGQYHMFVDSTS